MPFTYLAVPAITSLAPDQGPTAGGTSVTITGTDLAGATAVTIDGASVPFSVVSATQVTFTTPPHAARISPSISLHSPVNSRCSRARSTSIR